jgi:hypothetical protein
MYTTRIKERYRDQFKGIWWNDEGTEEYTVVATMGKKSLIYCEETKLLLDIYNNKLEVFHPVVRPHIVVEAKNVDYAQRYDIQGQYKIIGYIGEQELMLVVREIGGEQRDHEVYPSRLRVVEIV